MKYTFQHTAIIEHEIEAENIDEAREKFYSDVAESQEFFTSASCAGEYSEYPSFHPGCSG